MEYFDLIDDNGIVTGKTASRKDVHKNGLPHHACGVVIIRGGELLSQQRSHRKEKNAGLWDLTASGHIEAGEDILDALVREIEEELGVCVLKEELKFLTKYWRNEKYREDFVERELDYIYLLKKDIPFEKISVQEEEVENVNWISFEKFKAMIDRGEVVKRELWKVLFDLHDRGEL